ncbi:MAG: hypothetical protein ABI693_35105 [Bryobacteraceae bacterium]
MTGPLTDILKPKSSARALRCLGLLLPFTLLVLPGHSQVAALSINTVTADAQGGPVVSISLASGGQSFTAIQFDIGYEYQALALSILASPTVQSLGKKARKSDLRRSLQRVLIAGPNQNAIPDGVIATLSVEPTPEAPSGLHPLFVRNGIGSDRNGRGHIVLDAVGGVILSRHTGPSPLIQAVANGASYSRGSVAPGEIVVIGGTLLGEPGINGPQLDEDGNISTSIAFTRVFFDGVPAPILYTMQEQLSAIVPYATGKLSQTSVQVEHHGVQSPPFRVPVARTAPGIFTFDQSGSGQGAVVNEDGTLNGPDNPAARGAIVSIYGTGEGQTTTPAKDGSIVDAQTLHRPFLPLTVSIGGQLADVLYAGSAGHQVAGLLQLNVRIPASVLPGLFVPLSIATEGTSAQPAVTIAIK